MQIVDELIAAAPTESVFRLFLRGSELYHQGEACSRCFVVLRGCVALFSVLADGTAAVR